MHRSQNTPVRSQGLFPCDAEVARRLSMSADRLREIMPELKRQGFPRRDPLTGGRYWPAIVAFWDGKYRLNERHIEPRRKNWEENLGAL
jgi:hypothetical protein